MADKEKDTKTDQAELEAEIDGAVDGMVKDMEAARKEEAVENGEEKTAEHDADTNSDSEEELEGKEVEKDDEKVDNSDDNKNEGDDSKDNEDAVTDEHLERAVKAGLSIADARKFGSASLLESMVSRLEIAHKTKTDDAGEGDGEAEDPLKDFPDLDPEDFDEKIVEAVKALKDFARSQHKEIKELRKAGRGQSTDEWLDGQRDGLEKPVAKAVEVNPEKWTEIRGKFDVLTAGYKAAEQNVGRAEVLKEAIGITMGDVIAQAKADKQAKDLAKRAKQHTNRPSGNKGKADEEGDMLEAIGEEVDSKFGDKSKK